MPTISPAFWHLLSPEILLLSFGVLFLILSAVPSPKELKRGIGGLCLLGFLLTLVLTIQTLHMLNGGSMDLLKCLPQSGGYVSLSATPFSQIFKAVFLVAAIITVLMSFKHLDLEDAVTGEYYTFMNFAVLGMMIMASGRDLLTLWVGLETMALSVYVLAAYLKRNSSSIEGAVKYFLLGAVSSGFYLYGASFIYGATGSLHLDAIRFHLSSKIAMGGISSIGFPMGVGLLIISVAMLFKAALVPFHWWTPDAYEGAATPITAFMSVAPKAAAFALALRIFIEGFGPVSAAWTGLLAIVAIVTMVWGNVGAMLQNNVKRMLAYSSIAHAGYTLIGLIASGVTGNNSGIRASLFYLLVYTFMNLGAFAVIIFLQREDTAGDRIEDFSGLIHRNPAIAIFMLIFLLSLAGIPPTAGFVGKLQLFNAAVEAKLWALAVIGILTSVISLYYYFRIVYTMFLREEVPSGTPRLGFSLGAAVGINLVATLAIGLYAQPLVVWVSSVSLLR